MKRPTVHIPPLYELNCTHLSVDNFSESWGRHQVEVRPGAANGRSNLNRAVAIMLTNPTARPTLRLSMSFTVHP